MLGKSLLAHAYVRSGQRHMALMTLCTALGDSYYELEYELNNDLESTLERYQKSLALSSTSGAPLEPISSISTAVSSKKGKKGKKKPTATASKQPPPKPFEAVSVAAIADLDLIDQLDNCPSLPEKLDAPPVPVEVIVTDETTLATFAVSLQGLKLPLTCFQMYASAATVSPTEVILRKTFCSGLNVLAAPPKWNSVCQERLEAYVLSHIQSIALQYARYLAPSGKPGFELPTAWAAQVALWQLQWLPEDEKRQKLLPRLAESMVNRLVEAERTNGKISTETILLGFRILEMNSKWEEMLLLLEDAPFGDVPGSETNSNKHESTNALVVKGKARLLKKLNRGDECRSVYETLLKDHPDDWACWKGHLESSICDDNLDATQALVDRVLKEHQGGQFQLRGPHLTLIEIALQKVRCNATKTTIRACGASIQTYAENFASRTACAFSDLEKSVDFILSIDDEGEVVFSLLSFAEALRKANHSAVLTGSELAGLSTKERCSMLRSYTFAVKMTQKLLSVRMDLSDRFLPDWKEVVAEWTASLSLTPSSGGEEVS